MQIDAIRNRLQGTFLEGCPLIPTSTATGEGYDEILKTLDSLLTENLQRPDIGAARLFIDRRFTIQGMGTVVTGTLLEGNFAIDQQVEVQPSGLKTRIRNLQTHKHGISLATPGSRVAINLAGIEKTSIDRGEAVCLPESLTPTQYIAAEFSLLESARLALKNGFEISFLLGTADVLGRIYFLESDSMKPGQQSLVRFRLKSPVAAKLGDKFIIRRISPQDTIGGGRVLDIEFARDNKNKNLQKEILRQRLDLTPENIILTELEKNIRVPLQRLYRGLPFDRKSMQAALNKLAADNVLVISGDNILSRKSLEKFAQPARELIEADHDLRPWSDGVDPGVLAKKLKIKPDHLPVVVDFLVSTGGISYEKGLLKLASHQAQLKPDQLKLQGRLIARLSASPLASPARKEFIDEDPKFEVVINFLRDKGDLVELKGGILLTKRDFEEIAQQLVAFLKQTGKSTASDIKTHLKTSRKYVIPFLERLDQIGVTRRDGDYRSLAD
jgi:selenocysteine-specific elongation factor